MRRSPKPAELDELERVCDPRSAMSAAATPRSRSGKATFSATRHMREERVVLEHHADVALVRRQRR